MSEKLSVTLCGCGVIIMFAFAFYGLMTGAA